MHDNLDVFNAGGRVTKTLTPEEVKIKPLPAVVLINPKFPHNVGAAVRALSCYGVEQLWYTGNRVSLQASAGLRLPREERMRGYKEVDVFQYDRPLDLLKGTPVAVEVRENSELLPDFDHPQDAVYVFGPEDGSIPKSILNLCHRFVIIPTRHCLNLGAAINTVLYDRGTKLGFPADAGYNSLYSELGA